MGFTLVELLVVIAILGVLTSLAFPFITKATLSAQKTACLANLRQIGVAQTLYSNDNDNYFTPNRSEEPGVGSTFWCQLLVPYLSGGPVVGWPNVAKAEVFHCPAAKNLYPTDTMGYRSDYVEKLSFSQNILLGGGRNTDIGYAYPPQQRRSAVKKPSKMVLVTDGTAVNVAPWSFEPGGPYRHNGGCNLLFVDGHVETGRYPLDPNAGNKTYNWSIGNEDN